jgi:hypothetical protein
MSREKEVRKTPGRDDLPLERVAVLLKCPGKSREEKTWAVIICHWKEQQSVKTSGEKWNGKNPGCVGLPSMREAVY